MTNPKHPVPPVEQATQNDHTSTRIGFKEIDLKIAYRALIDGFLQSGLEEIEEEHNQPAQSDEETS